jgi:hypothetical protein
MVTKISDNGGVYHEPPYTEEEEAGFYRRMGGWPVIFFISPRAKL